MKWTIFQTDKIDLAKQEYHLVDLAYQIEGNDFFVPVTLTLPNSLLDDIKILSLGKFNLYVTVYGDNINPISEQIGILVSPRYNELKFIIDNQKM